MFAADIIGNGRADLVFVYSSGGALQVRTALADPNHPGKFLPTIDESFADGAGVLSGQVLAADVNSDKRADLIFVYNAGGMLHARTALADPKHPGFFLPTIDESFFEPASVLSGQAFAADVNGDGRADLVFAYSSGGALHISTASADPKHPGYFQQAIDQAFPDGAGVLSDLVFAADTNKDGRADLIFAFPSGAGVQARVAHGNADGTFAYTVAYSFSDWSGVYGLQV